MYIIATIYPLIYVKTYMLYITYMRHVYMTLFYIAF